MINYIKHIIKRVLILNPTKANYKFILKDWIALKDLNALSKVLESKRFSQNLDPVIMSHPQLKKVLVIAPHPDDDVFSSGGTILKLVKVGCEFKVVYLTSGSPQTYQVEKSHILTDRAAIMEKESKEVSKQIGTTVEFWRFNNREINLDEPTLNRLRNTYAEFQPDAVFLPFIADDHDDHRRAVQLFYESFKDYNKLDYDIWAYQVYSNLLPNVVVDITDVIDEKIRLINLWDSVKCSRDWGHYIKGLNAFNCRFLKTNQAGYAECFFVVPGKDYIDLCRIYYEHPQNDLYHCDSYKS